ncbi:MAG: NUDIX hydrolase [Planctomycetota bacterium]
MARDPIPTWTFAIVVVRRPRDGKFLVVHERGHGQRWYLPAGRVEPGESIFAGALRETLEESGVPVELSGLLEVQHMAFPDGNAKLRVILLAEPREETPPLSPPGNEHSLEARGVDLAELAGLPLRSDEVRLLFQQVASGRAAAPLACFQSEALA